MVNKSVKTSDKTVSAYLKSIDLGPLLTGAQEQVLLKNIEVFQREIMENLIKFSYARKQLKDYLENLETSEDGITDISKKLGEESSASEKAMVLKDFTNLKSALESSDISTITSLLDDVSLTGTIVHGVVSQLKKTHFKILEAESAFKSIHKWSPKSSKEEFMQLVLSENAKDFMNTLGFTGIKADNKLNEWRQICSELSTCEASVHPNTPKEFKEMFKLISKLESDASKFKNELITKNLRLVVFRAKKHIGKGLDFEDLIQEGNLGLIKAVDKFDSSKKTKISTYATWWIDQSIKRSISNKGKTVRVPTHIEWMETNLNKLIGKLTQDLQRQPTLKEISEASGVDVKTLEDLQNRAQHEIPLETELASGLSLIDVLPSDPNQSPLFLVEQKVLKEKIRKILSTLNPRTEKIIRLRFGIGELPDDEGMTLQEIANHTDLTKQGVRVVECAALKALYKKSKKYLDP